MVHNEKGDIKKAFANISESDRDFLLAFGKIFGQPRITPGSAVAIRIDGVVVYQCGEFCRPKC